MQLRQAFPILNDGFFLQQLSNQTEEIVYPGSSGVQTETGMWSVMRSLIAGVQDVEGDSESTNPSHISSDENTQPIWLVYSNLNESRTYEFECSNNGTDLNITALIAPFDSGTTVKNLFYPFDEHTLEKSARTLGLNGSTNPNGCLNSLDMVAYDFKAYVPIDSWIGPQPMLTSFSPGHDARILSKVGPDGTEDVEVELQYSTEMDCDSVTNSIEFNSTTDEGNSPRINQRSVKCGAVHLATNSSRVGEIQSAWSWSATLSGVANGIHSLTVRNASAADGKGSTNSVDRLLFRVGQQNNPMVFARAANYSSTLLSKTDNGKLRLNQSAAGADSYRYSTNFASTFSDWLPYKGGVSEIEPQEWSGTSLQKWDGEHVRVEYFSRLGGTSDHVQEADVGSKQRRFPHMFLNGPYNQYGFDAGLNNKMKQSSDNNDWILHWFVEWSKGGSLAQINIWGVNPDGQPDQTIVMGDADGDSVLDRMPPSSLSAVVLNVTQPPPKPYLSWRFVINDGSLRFRLEPAGSMWAQLILYILLWVVPICTAALSAWLFVQSFYKVKFNEIGIAAKAGWFSWVTKRPFQRLDDEEQPEEKSDFFSLLKQRSSRFLQKSDALEKAASSHRRTVLIATMEYDIEDWEIKIKIGGLGVMAQLMGKNLGHQGEFPGRSNHFLRQPTEEVS